MINRGRQYGKTTTLRALEEYLKEDYLVLSLDFQQIGTGDFVDDQTFVRTFSKKLLVEFGNIESGDSQNMQEMLSDFRNHNAEAGLDDLFVCLSRMCEKSSRPIVLMIDEVDSASNNQVFVDFLAQLRSYYLKRDKAAIFHSVILAGVYDIKNLKLKLRPDSGHQYNSPWNIADDFDIDMSLSADQIAEMLGEYEADKRIGKLRDMIEDIIYRGRKVTFSPEQKAISLGLMFGFLKEENGHVAIANRMFEMCLLNLFMAEESGSEVYAQGGSDRIGFIKDNMLDMELVLKKFVEYFTEICGQKDSRFIESQGRKLFLIYLKPIINGTGNYYIEAQTRDERRTDVMVDYLGEQFIIELKIWHGSEYNERGVRQLTDYLDYYRKDKGYMLSFNFNRNKETGVRKILVGDKTIVEAVV